jgi:hypothetical protein
MLMIGDLYADEQRPTALPAALRVLVAAAENEKFSDAIRAAAMVGIQRHAALGSEDEEVRRLLTTAMLRLLTAADPPGNPAALPPSPVRQWICRRAIDTLGRFGSVGENNAVFNAILKIVADIKLSLYTRSTAAETLGRLNYTGAAGINAVEAAAMLGRFVIDACNEELRQAANPNLDFVLLRRFMKQHLVAASTALEGIEPMLKEGEQRTFGGDLQNAVKAKIDFIDDPKTAEEDITPEVEKLKTTLEAWLPKQPK